MQQGRRPKFDPIADAYAGNAYPAMLEDLAAHLQVSAASIAALGIGWAPGVPTSKGGLSFGKSNQGFWAAPTRDDSGRVIGLAVRDPWDDSNKFMYPGSKQGLFYAVNPDHVVGQAEAYRGQLGWEYPSPCPVCGNANETQWCAVASNGAVCWCHRKAEGAEKSREGDGAYLHVLRPDLYVGNRPRANSPLPDSEHPVLVVEGWTDAAAAMDLGFVAVGKPSNLGGLSMLADLVRGRSVVVVGENDQKSNGDWPGDRGMMGTYTALRRACRVRTLRLPGPPDGHGPEGNKDFRAWKNKRKLTQDDFLLYLAKHAQEAGEDRVIPEFKPYTIARFFLDQNFKIAGHYTLRRWQQNWYRFTGSCYEKITDESLSPVFHKWADDKLVNHITDGGKVKPAQPLVIKLGGITEEMTAHALVEAKAMPCWINETKGPDPRNMVVFANGVLDVEAYFAGRPDAFMDSTPDLFCTATVAVDFDPTATCPRWLLFLASVLGDGPLKIELLQEWMGYLLAPDTRQQKFMYFHGPPAAGKGTVMFGIMQMLGQDRFCASSFADLNGFGLSNAVGKLAIVMEDVTTPSASEARAGLANLLKIVGEGPVQVNRKHQDHLDAVFVSARITMASNGYIDVKDDHVATGRRLLILPFEKSFEHAMDQTLRDQIAPEAAGIALWALEGLRRLRSRGHFCTPPSMEAALREWRKQCSPFAQFLGECCDDDKPELRSGKREVFDAYGSYCREHGFIMLSMTKFNEFLRSNAAAVKIVGEQYHGLGLKDWARKQYLGRP